jgi:hypothetical protein
MGEIAISPVHNVFKKYREVIYVNPYLMTAPAPVIVENTFIGGVASSLYTAQLLATKLAIDVSRITAFSVLGSDIKCKITGSYVSAQWLSNSLLTYYYDNDNLMTSIGSSAFGKCPNFLDFKFDGVVSLGDFCFEDSNKEVLSFPNVTSTGQYVFFNAKSKSFHLPRCANLGGSASYNNVFNGVPVAGTLIYAHPSLQTNNAGGVDGDLVGRTVRYVTNFTAPNPVTTLASGTIYNTAIQLNFTPPTGSTNAIDYYECYVEGVFKSRINSSGDYVKELNQSVSYNITLISVDIFYNKSILSNILNVSTTNTAWDISNGLVSYYKLNVNSNDSFGVNNGVDTSVTYGVGKVGSSAICNGTTSKTIIGNPVNTQISQGTISCWVKATASGSSYRSVFGKTLAYNIFLVDGILMVYNWGSFGGAGNRSSGVNLNDGLWHHVAFVFESGTANNYLYLDGVLKLTFSWSVSAQNDNVCIGSSNSVQLINASIDEASIHNTKLTLSQINLIYNNGVGITL